MKQIRILAVLTLVGLMAFGQLACDRGSLVKNARRVNSALHDVAPILAANGVQSAHLQQALDISDRLVTAFETNNNASALELPSALITEFNGLVSQDVVRISNPATRTIVLVTLSIANIALHYVADAMAKEAPPNMMGAGPAVIQTFRARKHWRCRSSETGRFMNMNQCRAHPTTSVVETY